MTKEYKELFDQSGVAKRLIIHFPNLSVTLRNEDIVSESMEISESLCSEPELRFGSCEASVFKLRIIGNVIPLIGETFTVSMYVGDIAEPFVFGTYKVASDKPTADRKYRDIVAYDALYDLINADVTAWYNSILPNKDSTTTLRAFRDSLMGHCGIEQEEITLPNDDMVVERTIDPEVISGKDVLAAICEINGCFGRIGRNGKMRYTFLPEIVTGLYPMDELYPADNLFPRDSDGMESVSQQTYNSCKYEDFTTKRIGKLQIRQEENDIGCVIGNGENCYIVQDNFLVYGKDAAGLQAIGQRLFDVIRVVWYRPASVNAIGNPCLEVGAGIRVRTQYEIVETYILERTLKGIQALSDSYEAQGVETYSENVNGTNRDILQLKGKTNTLIRNVDELRSTIEDVEEGLRSEITQTANSIMLSVEDLDNQFSSDIQMLSNQISLRVTSGEVQSMIDITLDSIVLQADQINLNGYVSAGGGNFTIDENGNIRLVAGGSTNTVVEIGESGLEVSASSSAGSWQGYYGASGFWIRSGGSIAARMIVDANGNLAVTADRMTLNGSQVLTAGNLSFTLNSYNTNVSYTSVGNISIMSTNGYIAEGDGKYGNIASTGWVQGKVADLRAEIDELRALISG